MKKIVKVLCLIAGVVALGAFGREALPAQAEETYTYTYKGVTYEYSSTADGLVITGMMDDNEKYIEFPREINGCKVIGINKLPDSNASGIKVPEGYQFVGDDVFSFWLSLKSVELPESLISIGKSAFSGCVRLEEMVLPRSVVYIGDGVFRNCHGLREIEIPESVTSIGDSAFESCINLQKVKIPEGVRTIGEYAFYDCKSLKEVKIPEGVE